jgi:hypothetical protein
MWNTSKLNIRSKKSKQQQHSTCVASQIMNVWNKRERWRFDGWQRKEAHLVWARVGKGKAWPPWEPYRGSQERGRPHSWWVHIVHTAQSVFSLDHILQLIYSWSWKTIPQRLIWIIMFVMSFTTATLARTFFQKPPNCSPSIFLHSILHMGTWGNHYILGHISSPLGSISLRVWKTKFLEPSPRTLPIWAPLLPLPTIPLRHSGLCVAHSKPKVPLPQYFALTVLL